MSYESTKAELRTLRVKREIRRRKRQIKIRLALAATIFIVVLTSAISITSIVSKANEADNVTKAKLYTNVMVEYGSTLTKTAEEYIDYDYYDSMNDYISEVMFINHIKDADQITAGTHLIMPYYSELWWFLSHYLILLKYQIDLGIIMKQ